MLIGGINIVFFCYSKVLFGKSKEPFYITSNNSRADIGGDEMADKYTVVIIKPEEKDKLLGEFSKKQLVDRKAFIHGMCIELLTDTKDFKEMWEDNFYYMSDDVRPHGRIVAVMDQKDKTFRVLYEPVSKTCFIINTDYYGWVKSIALAIAGDFLEEYVSIHSRFSIHGSCIDFSGRGIAMIAPSGTGKTTHSFGLLFAPNAKLVSDDWFFVKLAKGDVIAYASEKNSYIRDDISAVWKVFEPLVKNTKLDNKGRGVANIEDALGGYKRRSTTVIKKVIILKRDPKDKSIIKKLTVKEAMNYLIANNYCNPHQLVNDESMLEKTEVHMVNTTKAIPVTHHEILKLVKGL